MIRYVRIILEGDIHVPSTVTIPFWYLCKRAREQYNGELSYLGLLPGDIVDGKVIEEEE